MQTMRRRDAMKMDLKLIKLCVVVRWTSRCMRKMKNNNNSIQQPAFNCNYYFGFNRDIKSHSYEIEIPSILFVIHLTICFWQTTASPSAPVAAANSLKITSFHVCAFHTLMRTHKHTCSASQPSRTVSKESEHGLDFFTIRNFYFLVAAFSVAVFCKPTTMIPIWIAHTHIHTRVIMPLHGTKQLRSLTFSQVKFSFTAA